MSPPNPLRVSLPGLIEVSPGLLLPVPVGPLPWSQFGWLLKFGLRLSGGSGWLQLVRQPQALRAPVRFVFGYCGGVYSYAFPLLYYSDTAVNDVGSDGVPIGSQYWAFGL